MTLAVLRLTRLVGRAHRAAPRTVAVLAVAWVACAAFGAQLGAGVPVASRADAGLVYDRARQIRDGPARPGAVRQEAAVDPFRDTPAGQLLTGLRGKDVHAHLRRELRPRSRWRTRTFAPPVDAVLDAGTGS